jgi:hypothetical protein
MVTSKFQNHPYFPPAFFFETGSHNQAGPEFMIFQPLPSVWFLFLLDSTALQSDHAIKKHTSGGWPNGSRSKSTCLASVRPRVQAPMLQNKKPPLHCLNFDHAIVQPGTHSGPRVSPDSNDSLLYPYLWSPNQ